MTDDETQSATDAAGSDFPPRIGRPAERALAAAGIVSWESLSQRRQSDLAALHGIGPKALRLLTEGLTARGSAFRAD